MTTLALGCPCCGPFLTLVTLQEVTHEREQKKGPCRGERLHKLICLEQLVAVTIDPQRRFSLQCRESIGFARADYRSMLDQHPVPACTR